MKKNSLKKNPEQPRRLTLSRETIQRLESAELVSVAGGNQYGDDPTTSWRTFCNC